jgi:integrase
LRTQQEQWLASGKVKVAPQTPAFATVDGEIMSPRSSSKAWERVTKRLDIKGSFHATGHHHASCLIAAGIDGVTISRCLGRSSPAITLKVYAHLMKSDDRAAKVMPCAEAGVDIPQQPLKKKRSGANSGRCRFLVLFFSWVC